MPLAGTAGSCDPATVVLLGYLAWITFRICGCVCIVLLVANPVLVSVSLPTVVAATEVAIELRWQCWLALRTGPLCAEDAVFCSDMGVVDVNVTRMPVLGDGFLNSLKFEAESNKSGI